jgi:hypothetical protein
VSCRTATKLVDEYQFTLGTAKVEVRARQFRDHGHLHCASVLLDGAGIRSRGTGRSPHTPKHVRLPTNL